MENKTYNMTVYCENCDFKGKTEIPQGVKIERHSCPNCGTHSLKKDFNPDLGV